MNGMNAHSGKHIDGIEHLRQSVIDILTTPIGTRIMRPAYGSRLFDLVDAPLNQITIAEFYAATAEALSLWEPRLTLNKVKLVSVLKQKITLDLYGEYDSKFIILGNIALRSNP